MAEGGRWNFIYENRKSELELSFTNGTNANFIKIQKNAENEEEGFVVENYSSNRPMKNLNCLLGLNGTTKSLFSECAGVYLVRELNEEEKNEFEMLRGYIKGKCHFLSL